MKYSSEVCRVSKLIWLQAASVYLRSVQPKGLFVDCTNSFIQPRHKVAAIIYGHVRNSNCHVTLLSYVTGVAEEYFCSCIVA